MKSCQDRLVTLRGLLSEPPTRQLAEAVLNELGDWLPGEDRSVGVEYALSHMLGWPDALRRVPRIWLEAVVDPHIEARSPLRAVLRPYATDGYLHAEVGGLPWGDDLVCCEFCERYFEDHPRLWVSWSGGSITCIHCFFSAHFLGIEEYKNFVESKRDEAGRLIGGVKGYVERFSGEHDPEGCPWGRFESEHLGCFLCAARRRPGGEQGFL